MLKSFPIHGVGKVKFYDYLTGREVLTISKQESAQWTFTYDQTDVKGGEGLDAFDSFETGRAQSVTFVDNVFDVRQLEVATGKKPVYALSVPIVEFNEGYTIPAAPGPYTVSTAFHPTTIDTSVRVKFDNLEDFAPVPPALTAITEITGATWTIGDAVDVRLTAVLASGIESCASAILTHTVVAATAALQIVLPSNALTTPVGLPLMDVNELAGFNVYLDDGVAEYKCNAAPLPAGSTYLLPATPGAGLSSPDATPTKTGQYTVASGVITFSAADAAKLISIDYAWTTSASVAECTVVDILTNCLRGFLRGVWRVNFRSSDGSMRGLEMDIFKCKYTGDYTLDITRTDASKPSMKFDVMDPERADGKVVGWKIFPLPNVAACS